MPSQASEPHHPSPHYPTPYSIPQGSHPCTLLILNPKSGFTIHNRSYTLLKPNPKSLAAEKLVHCFSREMGEVMTHFFWSNQEREDANPTPQCLTLLTLNFYILLLIHYLILSFKTARGGRYYALFFFRWYIQGWEKRSDLPKVTQPIGGRPGLKAEAVGLQRLSRLFTPSLSAPIWFSSKFLHDKVVLNTVREKYSRYLGLEKHYLLADQFFLATVLRDQTCFVG